MWAGMQSVDSSTSLVCYMCNPGTDQCGSFKDDLNLLDIPLMLIHMNDWRAVNTHSPGASHSRNGSMGFHSTSYWIR